MESQEPTTDIISAAKRYRMFQPGDKVLVAVSGGPDSVAMLHALHNHADEFRIKLHVAHLNHMIRGEAAGLDKTFVAKLAKSLHLSMSIGRSDVPRLQRDLRIGMEEAARLERHTFLRETAEDRGANKIALGHTADDRAETVLLNVIRGCGIDGLAAMRPISGNIVRPLIETYRSEVEAYIAEHHLEYRTDESNADTTYTRNRVRHDLLPLLTREFNPEVKGALVRLAEIATAQSDLIKEMAESARVEVGCEHGMDAGLFLRLPETLQYEVLRLEIERVKGDLKDITFEQTHGIIEALHGGGDFTITLPPGNIYASREAETLRIWLKRPPAAVGPFEYGLDKGDLHIPEAGLVIKARLVSLPTPLQLPPNEALIDVACRSGRLRFRNPRAGDRIVPLGMTGSKKLQDIFVDKKIPREGRARAVVVCDDEKILWVVGVVTSELGKVTDDTLEAVRLTAVPDR